MPADPPRRPPPDDERHVPYRLRDDDGETLPVVPAPRPARRRADKDDVEDLRPRRRRPTRKRSMSVPAMDVWVRVLLVAGAFLLVLFCLAAFGAW